MLKKMILASLMMCFVLTGTAMAANMTVSGWTGGNGEIYLDFGGELDSAWGYCLEKSNTVYQNQTYDCDVIDIASYAGGYDVAWLTYNAYTSQGSAQLGDLLSYNTSVISSADQTALQAAIWDVMMNGTSYYQYYNGYQETLSSLFDIADTGDGIQDMLIFNNTSAAVPVPGTGLLLGFGLIGLVAIRRNN